MQNKTPLLQNKIGDRFYIYMFYMDYFIFKCWGKFTAKCILQNKWAFT